MSAPTRSSVRRARTAWFASGLRTLAAAALLLARAVAASPADDYRAGEFAFQRGDVVAAMGALRKAADAGHSAAQVLLAYLLDQSSLDAEAVRYYRLAAAQGDADGAYGLAGMVALGEGVARDEARAVELYEEAARRGHPSSIELLAQAYADRRLGLVPGRRDDARALLALRRAAERGFAPAASALADAYRGGDFGVAADAAEADRWAAIAAARRPGKAKAGAR